MSEKISPARLELTWKPYFCCKQGTLAMMIQTLPKVTTFDKFVEFLPENSGVRYELAVVPPSEDAKGIYAVGNSVTQD